MREVGTEKMRLGVIITEITIKETMPEGKFGCSRGFLFVSLLAPFFLGGGEIRSISVEG